MEIYIVVRPVDNMKQFLSVYITTYKGLRRARRKCDYYESEGIDCDIVSEYRIIKAIDDHYIDLWL